MERMESKLPGLEQQTSGSYFHCCTKQIMRTLQFIMAATLTMALIGCSISKPPGTNSPLQGPHRSFKLYVSNQSFAIDPVDIRVEIDGKLVVSDDFKVGSQHTFIPFELVLTEGSHRIHIVSKKGEAQATTEFTVGEHNVGVVTYWYYPESHYHPTPRHFGFQTQKGPLLIM
jgi:hypothetical protein